MWCILHKLYVNHQKHAPTILFKNLKSETKTEGLLELADIAAGPNWDVLANFS